jgi:hypothetical protein
MGVANFRILNGSISKLLIILIVLGHCARNHQVVGARSREIFCNILFSMCTSTLNKLCKHLYSGL